MSRRARAVAFMTAAIACAVLAATLASGYGRSVSAQLGELRPTVVARERLVAGRAIGPKLAARALEVRRVPVRFAPANALTSPAEAIGRAPAGSIEAGEYLTLSRLRSAKPARRGEPRLRAGLSPIEIRVSGAGALAASAGGGVTRVDIAVTRDSSAIGSGRTYVAARGVRLLSLTDVGAGGTGGANFEAAPSQIATLALTRAQALRLIDAESFARQIRLIPRG